MRRRRCSCCSWHSLTPMRARSVPPRPQTLGEVESIEEAASTLARLALHDSLPKHLWQRARKSFERCRSHASSVAS